MSTYKKSKTSINLILQSASILFLEKGYKVTTMNDIAKHANLSKGAIYHHFKSKEEVFRLMCSKIEGANENKMKQIVENTTLTGAEKMNALLSYMFNNSLNDDMRSVFKSMLDLPEYLSFYVKQIYEVIAPKAIKPIIEEGISDGTITGEYPEETAEIIIILANLWLAPLYSSDERTLIIKLKLFNKILNSLGIVVPDEIINNYLSKLNMFNKEPTND